MQHSLPWMGKGEGWGDFIIQEFLFIKIPAIKVFRTKKSQSLSERDFLQKKTKLECYFNFFTISSVMSSPPVITIPVGSTRL